MGTDVHASFHYRAKNEETNLDEWRFCEHNYEGNRHYRLFGWIADVRNGYGFAGCDTGDAIKPIAEPRGLPKDLITYPEPAHEYSYADPAWSAYYNNGGAEYGDHSFTWLTSTEILQSAKELTGTKKRGVISLASFIEWDKTTPPDSYCGGIGGHGNVTIPADRITQHHIKASAYQRELKALIGDVYKPHNFKVRFVQVKKPTHRTSGSLGWFTSTFGYEPIKPDLNTPDELVWVSKRKDNMRPARRKHLRKLERYAARLNTVNVKCEWSLDGDDVRKEFAYFTDEVQRLHDLHGEVRFVAGFDS